MVPEDAFDNRRGLIPATQPNDFGRLAAKQAEIGKVHVLSDNGEAVRFRVVPQYHIVDSIVTGLPGLLRFGEQVTEKSARLETEILIKEQLQD